MKKIVLKPLSALPPPPVSSQGSILPNKGEISSLKTILPPLPVALPPLISSPARITKNKSPAQSPSQFPKQKSATSFNIEELPLPALQEVLLKMKRSELNKMCNLSRRVKKVCDEHNFKKMYNKLHVTYTDDEVEENVSKWIRDMIGKTNLRDVKNIKLKDIVNILDMIENKTIENKTKIIFYGEEVFSSNFVERTGALEAGFVANSFFVGIIGSIVIECIMEPKRLKYHIEMYQELSDEGVTFNVEGFLLYLYNSYKDYSDIFNLDETFKGESYRRIVDDEGLRYEKKRITKTLKDVEVFDVEKLKKMLK